MPASGRNSDTQSRARYQHCSVRLGDGKAGLLALRDDFPEVTLAADGPGGTAACLIDQATGATAAPSIP